MKRGDSRGECRHNGVSISAATATVLTCLAVLYCGQVRAESLSGPPNIVFVLADDLGWSELGCYGNSFHDTPNLDRLATEGLRFTDAYAAAPVCSPYRAALLTGQYPARVGIVDYLRPNSSNALSTSYVTLAEMLGENGYTTGHIGKWHLSGYSYHGAEHELKAQDHGFTWSFGGEVKGVGNGANFWPYVFRRQPIRWLDVPSNRLGDDEYLTDRLNLEAVDFIERSAKRDQPFFLYLSHYAPHTILNGRPDLVQKYIRRHPPGKSGRSRCCLCEDDGLRQGDPGHHWAVDHNPHLAAMLESIDDGIGMITRKLDALGIGENTIFVFTSDNGGETNVTTNAPLRGGKSELYEGGIRVPLIVRWPKVIPAGVDCEHPTQNVDFYPTLLAAAGIDPDANHPLDGVSTLATWKEPDVPIERDFLAWHYPLDRPHFLGGVSGGAIRSGDWKLIEHFDSGQVQLFALQDDPGELVNLAVQNVAVVDRLRRKLRLWRESVGARTPSPPLLTEPRQLYFAEHFNPGHLSQRLWYNADWKAEAGVLKRIDNGSGNTRIFLKDAEYRDAIIRFDFRLGNARDVRLMTGSGGHYNTILHLRPDHFYLQTAKDKSVPYFAFRHGECAFEFDPERWYTMTVEFLGEEAIAHLDQSHVVHARHPIINRTREYFALQVDEHAAEFDNVQILSAVSNKDAEARARMDTALGRLPVEKTTSERFEILRTNAHESYYQNDTDYRDLVLRVEELDEVRKQRFPDAFRTLKEYRSLIQGERRRLLETDPMYKQLLSATHKADRAVDQWIMTRQPDIERLRGDRRKAIIAELRDRFSDDPELLALTVKAMHARVNLESAFPQLFISDAEIAAARKKAINAVRNDSEFQRLSKERAQAYRAQRDYLLRHDEELKQLNAQMNTRP